MFILNINDRAERARFGLACTQRGFILPLWVIPFKEKDYKSYKNFCSLWFGKELTPVK
jgi:hypothetical protein